MTEQEYMELMREFDKHFKRMAEIANEIDAAGGWAFPLTADLKTIASPIGVRLLASEDDYYNWHMPQHAERYEEALEAYTTVGKEFFIDGTRYYGQLSFEDKEVK